ncbi:hypothetical protein WJX72_012400 [[Myrmecia] bisecta]|uniref:Sugar phosphate transporter domain-containing protein n=1 Tax=[Myrmecia] bisecta TaxID=41462 RepID=A0AAW1PUH1_9CHLO
MKRDVETGKPGPTPEHTFATRLLACVSYGAVSVSITLFNKAVFSVYKFHFPAAFTTMQIAVSILYMYILRHFKLMEFGRITRASARAVFPLALFWWLYVVSGVTALRYLNVPMYSVFRRSTTFIVVIGEYMMFSKIPSLPTMGSILLMVVGAVVAGATDLTYSLPGYIWVSICAVSTAVYLLLIRMLKDKTGLSQSALMLYNNVLGLPLMLSYMVVATDEVKQVPLFPKLYDATFLAFLLLSASQAFLLNLCIFRCTTVNSPLATTVTGQMKDIITTGLGMFLFGDVVFNMKNLLGVCIGLAGGIVYSLLSYSERTRVVKEDRSKS